MSYILILFLDPTTLPRKKKGARRRQFSDKQRPRKRNKDFELEDGAGDSDPESFGSIEEDVPLGDRLVIIDEMDSGRTHRKV